MGTGGPTIVGMMRIRLSAALATAACVLLAAFGSANASAAGARSASGAQLGGVNILSLIPGASMAEADAAISSARALHAKVVRTDLPWSAFEPQAAQTMSAPALAFADHVIDDAASAGLRVIITVDSTPCWDSTAPPALLRKCKPGSFTAANSWPPKNPSDYAAFVAFLARRYGSKLAAIEVWNEPDQSNEKYFAGPNKPARYAAILRAAYPAIKQADPQLTVLGGSLVGSNGSFLKALYAAGIKGFYDGLSVHFYNLTLASLRAIHEVQLAAGDNTPLWLDEFGWTSCWPHRIEQEQGCVTTQTQASNLANAFRSFAQAPYLAAAVVYKLQDSRSEDFGVLSTTGTRKPSFKALAQVLKSSRGPITPVTLRLARDGSRVRASGSGPVGDFMQLEAFQGTVLRYRALFTLNRFNDFSITLPAALGTSGLRVRVYQYWAGVGKAAQKSI
jgi:polysaccharide biosynthesis protein PslG